METVIIILFDSFPTVSIYPDNSELLMQIPFSLW